MDWQIIIVSLIILAASAYVGRIAYLKITALSTKRGCGNDCGCGIELPNKKAALNK